MVVLEVVVDSGACFDVAKRSMCLLMNLRKSNRRKEKRLPDEQPPLS